MSKFVIFPFHVTQVLTPYPKQFSSHSQCSFYQPKHDWKFLARPLVIVMGTDNPHSIAQFYCTLVRGGWAPTSLSRILTTSKNFKCPDTVIHMARQIADHNCACAQRRKTRVYSISATAVTQHDVQLMEVVQRRRGHT